LVCVLIERKRAPVGRERGDANQRRNQPQSVLLKLQVTDDLGTKRTGSVCKRGTAEAGMKFIRDGGTAHLLAAFDDQRFEPRLGQIESGDQPVVAAANDDDVACACGLGHS
jgi:hypothetical protein